MKRSLLRRSERLRVWLQEDPASSLVRKYSLPSTGEPIYITKGLVIVIGRDKEKFGLQCAEYALQILNGADPGKLPIDVGKAFSISQNIEAVSARGMG